MRIGMRSRNILALLCSFSLWNRQEALAFSQRSLLQRPQSSRLHSVDPTSILDTFRDVTTGGALAVSGDILAQSLAARGSQPDDDQASLSFPPEDWDNVRTVALGVFGALYTGGAQHFIFGFINASLSDPIQRLLLAQFLFIPFLYYPCYTLLVPALRTLPLESQLATVERQRLQSQVIERLPATLVRNWGFWIPVQFVQFSFIPPEMQVTYCAAFGVVWNAILSWSTMQESTPVIPAGIQSSTEPVMARGLEKNAPAPVATEK